MIAYLNVFRGVSLSFGALSHHTTVLLGSKVAAFLGCCTWFYSKPTVGLIVQNLRFDLPRRRVEVIDLADDSPPRSSSRRRRSPSPSPPPPPSASRHRRSPEAYDAGPRRDRREDCKQS